MDSIITALVAGIPAFVVSLIILNAAPDAAFTQEQVLEQEDAALIATLVSIAIYLSIVVGYYVFLIASGGTWGKRIFGVRLELADTVRTSALGGRGGGEHLLARAYVATSQKTASRWSPRSIDSRLASMATWRTAAPMSAEKCTGVVGPSAAASTACSSAGRCWATSRSDN